MPGCRCRAGAGHSAHRPGTRPRLPALPRPTQPPETMMSDTESHAGLHDTAEAPMRTAVILPWQQDGQSRDAAARLAEAVELSRSIGLDVVHTVTLPLRAAQPATLLGSGQVATLGETIAAQRIGLAMVDAALSPVQQRNLERAWGCKVIDRT